MNSQKAGLVRESVKRKLNFDDEAAEHNGDNGELNLPEPGFKKRLNANFEAYLNDFPVSAVSAEITSPGWEIFLNFDVTRMLDVFPEQHRERVQALYNKIEQLIRKHYVKTAEFIECLARQENVDIKDFYTTTNAKIVDSRRTYHLTEEAEKDQDYLSLKMEEEDMLELYACCSTFVSLFLAAKVQKPSYLVNQMVKSPHIACFKPFHNDFDISLFTEYVKASANAKVINYLEGLASCANNAVGNEGFDLKTEPYLTLDGHLLLLCERGESRGANTSGKTFSVLNVINPSEQILREYFNTFIRDKFPNLFKSLSPMMFFNIVEARQVPKIFCLNNKKSLKNQVLVSANLAKIFLVQYKDNFVPQVQMYTNCIFEQK